MKSKIFLATICMFLTTSFLKAQSKYFYYYNSEKVYIDIDKEHFTLLLDEDYNLEDFPVNLYYPFELERADEINVFYFGKVQFQNTPIEDEEYFEKLNNINSINGVIKANPNFKNPQGVELGLSQYLYVKLKKEGDFGLLSETVGVKNIEIVEVNKFMPLWITLKITSETVGNTLDIANELFEMGLFDACQPDFLSNDITCSDDPLFNNLWGMKNTNYQSIDINICSAWEITKGENTIVAVLDQGIDKNHNDLKTNVYNLSYDSESGTSPSTLYSYHGTHVAGTIGAIKDNNLQVVGVSPKSKLMDISNTLGSNPNSRMKRADGINWAWQNGADVINNSWGSAVHYQVIDDAILNAIQNGREGKGTIIVFSTGNNSASTVGYPANSNDDILAVGAINQNGTRANFSNYGTKLDVVAPGVDILSTLPNNQTGYLNGTSMASPHVAGLAALILSVNPCLTGKEVRDIIEQTSKKVGGYSYTNNPNRPNGTWNNQMGYGLVDAYDALLLASKYKYYNPINSNTIWNSPKFVKGDLIIEQGTTLTINSTVRLSEESKIIIKQGAKLILDGGLLTDSDECGDFWQGIQVYGTTNKNQFPENNPTYQGLLVIKNGGTIENAHLAVSNWKVDDYNSIGGVIQTNNAVFRNNRRDVAFMSYQNYNPNYTSKYRNLSKFANTDFVTDDDFIEKGLAIQTHVTMWKVDGITFTNCHFSNNISANKNNSSAPNRGIYSIDAGYKVLAGCTTVQPIGQQCPTANLLKSSFSGFQTAIEATGSGTTESVLIQQSDIFENIFGITISNLDNVSINRNDISTGDAGYGISLGIGAGIYDATGYIVEENNVLNNQGSGLYLGIGVSNSLSEDNRIYKNSLEDLTIGLIGQGVNHNSNYQKGLQFLCNKLTNNQTALNMNSDPINDGVRFYQGDFSPLKSAGNRFIGNSLDIDNSANSIVYIHNGGDTEPINYQGLVTLQYTSNVNFCPTSFGGGIVMKPILLVLDSLNTELGGQTTSYNDLNFTYISLIDDGNTDQFKDNIELNWSSDAWLLRSKLLASSPYLSSEVLLEAAKQNILPNGMLLEILLANPDATRGERFINELKEVTNNTFPEYMLDYVRGNYDNRTLRTEMEGQLSSIHSNLSSTRNWIKHLTKSKEEYNNQDRLEVSKLGSEIYNKVGLMDYYIEQGNFNKADSVLNSIENDKKYKDDLSMIENFGNYINFRSNLGTRNLAQLDSTEIAYLQTLADNKGRVAGYAQNILCFFYNICYEKDLAFGNSQAKSMMLPPQNNQEELNNVLYNIKLYPNPANDYASIQWEIYDELKDANYRVVDLNGREQLSGVLGDNRGEQVLDTRKLKNGVYIIGIYNNNQLKVSKKLVIENQK